MFWRSRILPWIHLNLLLGERILALRASEPDPLGGELQSNGTPPERVMHSVGTPPERVRGDEVHSDGAPPERAQGDEVHPDGTPPERAQGDEVHPDGTPPPERAKGDEVQSNGTPPDRVRGGEVQSNGTPLEWVRGGEVSSNAAPPERVKGGCGAQKKDRCAWFLCKHEEYKTALERKKYESEVEAGVNFEMRDAPGEDQKRRSAEKRFLATKETERFLYKATIYFHKGRHCEWALDPTKFQGWLETLLPSRSRCVKEVVRLFEPDEETCAEGFTNTFKKELNENCKDVDAINPYHAADEAARNRAQVVVGMGSVLALVGAPLLAMLVGPGLPFIIAGLVLVSLAGLAFIVDLVCKQRGKNWVRFINRPERVAV